MSRKPELTVVICANNRAQKLARALDLYKMQTLPYDRFEMVLVNDGSTDNTGEVMREALRTLPGTYVEHNRNRGLSAAKNSAIGAARGDYIVFVNDDTYPNLDYCERVLNFQLAHAGMKIVGLSCLPFTDELQSRLFYFSMYHHNLYTPFIGMEEGRDYPFDHFIGTGTCFPRKAFLEEQIWFDEDYVTYGAEDMDCGYRLFNRGYRVRYNPQAVMYHDHEMTVQDYRNRCTKIGRNLIALCAKHPALRQHYLATPQVTPELIKSWRDFVGSNRAQVEKFTTEVEAIKDEKVVFSNAEEQQLISNLVQSIGSAVHLMFSFETKKSFVEILDAEPDLRARLMSDPVSGPGGGTAPQQDGKLLSNGSGHSEAEGILAGDLLLAQAEAEIEAGNLQGAKEKLRQILQASAGAEPRAVNDLAVIAILENNLAEAERLFNSLEQHLPGDGSIRDNIRFFRQLQAERSG